jgi:hypothetical protein
MKNSRTKIVTLGTAAAMSALAALGQTSDQTVSLATLLAEMADPAVAARWPVPAYTCKQASSYDRRSKTPADPKGWFANTDNMNGAGDSLRWETIHGRRECVLLDAEGPGAIVRFWSAGQPPKGKVRFYLDGANEPAIEAPLFDLLGGRDFVPRPLAIENAGAAINLYLPIPYARHCRITYDEANPANTNGPPPGRWYNIEYRTYPAGQKVRTFSMEQFRAQQTEVERVGKLLAAPPDFTQGRTVSLEKEVAPGEAAALALPAGSGAVRFLEASLPGLQNEQVEQALRSTVLRATFDGEETIWCPMGDFFGSSVGLNELQSWMRTVSKDGNLSCRWVMPYQNTAAFSLLNVGKHVVTVRLKAIVADWKWEPRSMHFRTSWRQQASIPTRPQLDWNYLTVAGRGVYVGDTLTLFNPVRAWWGEGDEKVWVDDESFPSHFGTGSEDYYGYAWGSSTLFQGPFCNQPRAGGHNQGHTTNTRIRVLDAIPFTHALKYDIEIWHWVDCRVTYGVATYWYGLPGASTSLKAAPEEAARDIAQLPKQFVLPGATECEQMKVLAKSQGLRIEQQADHPFPSGAWSQGAQLFVQARNPGDFIELLLAENVTGPRKVVLYATKSYDYGILHFSVNGQPVLKEWDGFNPQPVLSGPIELGTFAPDQGRLILRVEVVGENPAATGAKHFFGLDAVTLDK